MDDCGQDPWTGRKVIADFARGKQTGDWLLSDGTPGVEVAQMPLAACVHNKETSVMLRVDSGCTARFGPGSEPWTVGEASEELRRRVKFGRTTGAEAARRTARLSPDLKGCYEHPDGGVVLSVRVSDRCEHDESKWKRLKCGHAFCSDCDGVVCPQTRTCLQGPGPLISCNRKPLSHYKYWLRETFGGTERLTSVGRRRLPKGKTEEAFDLLKGSHHDLTNKTVWQREKQRAKSRECYFNEYSPPCRTFTKALRGAMFRSKALPYGPGEPHAKVDMDSELAVKTCALAKMNHLLGDAFAVEHPAESPLWEMDCFRELASLPGVFFVTFDNCEYGKDYRHRQSLLTNAPWLAALSRDCEKDTDPNHVEHRTIEGSLTKETGAFAEQLCERWIDRLRDFMNNKQGDCCPFCADRDGKEGKWRANDVSVLQERMNQELCQFLGLSLIHI